MRLYVGESARYSASKRLDLLSVWWTAACMLRKRHLLSLEAVDLPG